MAETVRTMITRTTKTTRDAGPRRETSEEVWVRSIRSDRLNVSVLRDLVAALDEASAPGGALVEGEKSQVGHLIQLRVQWSNDDMRIMAYRYVAPDGQVMVLDPADVTVILGDEPKTSSLGSSGEVSG